MKDIIIKGARQHNLKNISVTIPRDQFVVITGVSGSVKPTLAFDPLYAEGQRRFVESLLTYARKFIRFNCSRLGGSAPWDERNRIGTGAGSVPTLMEDQSSHTDWLLVVTASDFPMW
jgi:hypothetical protein